MSSGDKLKFKNVAFYAVIFALGMVAGAAYVSASDGVGAPGPRPVLNGEDTVIGEATATPSGTNTSSGTVGELPWSYSGEGFTATGRFRLDAGEVAINLTCASNCSLTLWSAESPDRAIASGELVVVDAGEYWLCVDAAGPWSVSVEKAE